MILQLKNPRVFQCLNMLPIGKQAVLGLVLETIVDAYVGGELILSVNLFIKFVSIIWAFPSDFVTQETVADI